MNAGGRCGLPSVDAPVTESRPRGRDQRRVIEPLVEVTFEQHAAVALPPDHLLQMLGIPRSVDFDL